MSNPLDIPSEVFALFRGRPDGLESHKTTLFLPKLVTVVVRTDVTCNGTKPKALKIDGNRASRKREDEVFMA